MTGTQLHTALNSLFRAGVLLTLCIAPTQWALELRPKFYLSPADLALAFSAGVWFLNILVTREWRRLPTLPPWPHLLFVGLACVSTVSAPDRLAALKDLVQYTEYFLFGYLLFAAFLKDSPRALKQALAALAAVTALILVLALVHYFTPACDALMVRGTFGNRNVLGGFLALAMPLLFGAALGVRSLWVRLLLALMLVAGLTVNLSGAAALAIMGVVACMAAARGPKLFVTVAAVLIVWQAFVLPRLPRENDLVHFQSVALYDGAGSVERRYPDWQAAYSMSLTHPLQGVGLGNYQKHVGQYYDNVPRRTGPSEPDIQNQYLVLAASAGLPALLAFLALLASAAQAARAAACTPHVAPLRLALAQGVAGSLCAFALTSVWHPLLVRGIGLPLVFIVALAYHLRQTEAVDGT